jgi:hypothetical protein
VIEIELQKIDVRIRGGNRICAHLGKGAIVPIPITLMLKRRMIHRRRSATEDGVGAIPNRPPEFSS